MIDLSRLNTFLLVERFKIETPECIRASLIPERNGYCRYYCKSLPKEWRRPASGGLSETKDSLDGGSMPSSPTVLPWFSSVPFHLPPFRPSHGLPRLYNDCKESEANGPHKRS